MSDLSSQHQKTLELTLPQVIYYSHYQRYLDEFEEMKSYKRAYPPQKKHRSQNVAYRIKLELVKEPKRKEAV